MKTRNSSALPALACGMIAWTRTIQTAKLKTTPAICANTHHASQRTGRQFTPLVE